MNKNDLEKVENIINSDRLQKQDVFNELLILDINKVLGEYFELDIMPILSINKVGNRLNVSLNFTANNIKKFYNISNQ